MFTLMANWITRTRMAGSDIDLKVKRMIMNIAATERKFTFFRSTSVVSCRSFIIGASPITIAEGSCFFTISFILASCAFTSSVADTYSEQTKASSCSSP